MVVDNPRFVYAIKIDDDDLMATIFWEDSKMVLDYQAFGDVVSFDSIIYWSKPSQENYYFWCNLVYDETIKSFQWCFDVFFKAMSNKHPKIVFKDWDKAMEKAISTVFPQTYHRICVAYVLECHEAPSLHVQNLPNLLGKNPICVYMNMMRKLTSVRYER